MRNKFSFVRRHLVVASALAVFLGGAAAETQAQQPEVPRSESSTAEPAGGGTVSALKKLAEGVEERVLSNGLRVLFYRRGTAPVFSGVVGVRVGGVDETLGETGISHMFEHMAFKGTPEVGTKDFEREKVLLEELEQISQDSDGLTEMSVAQEERHEELLTELEEIWEVSDFTEAYQKRGASGMNATTSKDLTNYFVSLPRPSFEFWSYIESERLVRTVYRQFYKERDVVMEERRMRYGDNPDGKLYERLLATAYEKHPYRQPVIGYPEDIQHLTATQLEVFHKKYYVAKNMVIALVGDVDADRDIAILEKYFGRIPEGVDPPRPTIVEPAQEGERRFSITMAARPRCVVAYHKPNYPHPDDAPLSVLIEVLSGSVFSPLYRELVETRRVATSVTGYELPGNGYPNMLAFQLMPAKGVSCERLLTLFDREVSKFKKILVDPEALERTKKKLAVDYLDNFDSSLSLARDLVYSELLFGGWRESLKWFDQVVAVEAEDVQRVATTYLQRESRTVGFLGG